MKIAEAAITPFVGRQAELGKIIELFSTRSCRLLTLIGPGGIGKTRLAIEAAQGFTFNDGVYFVPLQPLTSPDFVLTTIANEVGCQFQPGGDPHQQLINHFRQKSLLLVLDNLEHLLDAADLLSAILKSAPDVRILATSRERLNLLEEWALDLGGLDYPASEAETEIEDYGAVQLFLQHARRVNINFDLSDTQKPALIRICRLVRGMPLALELAAAWVRALSCEAIAAEIEKGLDILETPARNIQARHRNMRVALDWSWNLLTSSEKDVFQKLAVFHGGFTLDAAAYVTGASLQTLIALVDKSLVRVVSDGRYELHELLRQYTEEKLNDSPDEYQNAHDLHCAFYAEFMNQQWEHLQGRHQQTAMQAIQTEIDNIQAMWDWAVEFRRASDLEGSLESFWFYYDARLWFDAAEKALKSALDAFSPLQPEYELLYSKIAVRYGIFCFQLRRWDEGRILVEEALTILRDLDAPQELAFGMQSLAGLYKGEEAIRRYQESLTIYREIGDRRGAARVLYWIGLETYFVHQYAEAARFCEESLAIYRETGNPGGIASNLSILGWCAYDQGSYDEALRFHQEHLAFAIEAQNGWHIMESQFGLGLAHWALGQRSQALSQLQISLTQALKIGPEMVPCMHDILVELWPLWEKERAVELLSFGFRPTMWDLPFPTQKHGQEALEKLKSEMSPDTFQAAFERGKNLDLRATVEWLIEQLETLQNVPQKPIPQKAILNSREIEVLLLIAEGLTNQEIAEYLVLSVSTIKWYINEIFGKLDVTSRTQAVLRAQSLGLLA